MDFHLRDIYNCCNFGANMLFLEIIISDSLRNSFPFEKNAFPVFLEKAIETDVLIYPEKESLVTLIFVDDARIRELNRTYRKKDFPTDVLSFRLHDENSPEPISLFGEIYISLETAQKQAKEHNLSLQKELNKLFVHGLVHLFGFDHKTEEEYLEMNAIEKRILEIDK